MSRKPRRQATLSPSLSFALLVTMLALLCLAGGASRGDVWGQAVVRAGAALSLGVLALFGKRPAWETTIPALGLLIGSATLALFQLVPLPYQFWQALPARAVFLPAVLDKATWRPLAIAPEATFNALSSLLVPAAILLLAAGLRPVERTRAAGAVLATICLSMLIGAIQFSGSPISNIFINDTAGEVAGSFANSNHFALFMAMGCMAASAWATLGEARWRWSVALGLMLLFELLILGSGSRTGMLLGALGLVVGGLIAARPIRSAFRRYPSWVLPTTLVIVAMIGVAVLLASVATDRAASINRALSGDVRTDMRLRALPTVWAMAVEYFPTGAGFGAFDTVFRIHEPFELLKPTYFNHAHNDFIEVVIDGGLPALLLVVIGIGWWLIASARIWRASPSTRVTLGRLGSGMMLLIIVGSIVDYPARTPMIMAMMALAAAWLCWGDDKNPEVRPLPLSDQLI